MTAPLDLDGIAAPPRANGELLFAEPWHSRAFGMAVTLHDAGVFTWNRFQAALIARIGEWENAAEQDQPWSYYDHWLAALEDVLDEQGSVSRDDVATRAHALTRLPADHGRRQH
ncbi:nitrile hydratase accessory protein [Catellatospora sp. NPDC049133]|uniref:nitrile hydratase accessory protein n=1 Tax=Catellatospora sp. NPDC049133 TaxID=3155499 RepID=UPI0033EBDA71